MKFLILTFGCKVNLCESENIFALMVSGGYQSCVDIQCADIVIINSCAVTAESERKVRQAVRRVKKIKPNCILAVVGCMSQVSSIELQKLGCIDIILGNADKSRITEFLENYKLNSSVLCDVTDIKKQTKFENVPVNYNPIHSRAFLKIEEGCNRFCSYCIIPHARGRVRSKTPELIKKDAQSFADNGYEEIVLVGINLSCYGQDLGTNLSDAVKAVSSVAKIKRIRLGSLEPDLITDKIINDLSKEKKLCPHFHLALQSGSDNILRLMNRKYNVNEYLEVVRKIKSKLKNAVFTTDLMIGFPGETEEDFQNSLSVISKVGFLKTHVFPYSPRPKTPAASFERAVEAQVKSQRMKKSIEMSEKTGKLILNGFVGKTFDVLYETCTQSGVYEGYTSNYIYVKTSSPDNLSGKIVPTLLKASRGDYCIGIIVPTE